jgi:hypothetical protein
MTMDTQGFVFKFPGQFFSYRRVAYDSDESGIATALDAVDALRQGWEPLAAEAGVFGLEGEDEVEVRPPRSIWLLVRTALPSEIIVQSVMADPIRCETPTLSRPNLEAWLIGALAACSQDAPHLRPDWRELRFGASRTWLGPPDWRQHQTALQLQSDAGVLTAPLERDDRGTWVSGPREPVWDQPPLGAQVLQQWGALSLHVSVNYSLLVEKGEPAAAKLAEALNRVQALGWQHD